MRISNLLIFCLFSLFTVKSYGQENDSLLYIQAFYDLHFSKPQRDSIMEGLRDQARQIRDIHAFGLPNDNVPALVFDPLAFTDKKPVSQTDNTWDLPDGIKMPANPSELAYYSIPQLAALIRSKQISSVELTQFFIDRLKKYGDTLQCVISLTEERALKKAREADEALSNGHYLGPLHGIPYGLKDLFAVEGTVTSWGAMPYKDQRIETTAAVVRKLDSAGAILIAKLTLGALAMGDVWYGGITKNPWDLNQGSSGSSAGSASAVSAGLVPFAIGTETLGSIVSPSTRCGVTGLRPTFGRVSRAGAMALSWSMDKVGPITRSATECAMVFDVIRGRDPRDPSTYEAAFNYHEVNDYHKLRIAYLKEAFKGRPQDSLTLNELRKMGLQLTPVRLPEDFPAWSLTVILAAESSAAFDKLTRSGRDSLLVRQDNGAWPNYFRTARFIPATEYVNANRIRTHLIMEMNKLMKDYDVIIAPSFSSQLVTTNLTGHPCLVLPNGFDKNGRPTSITFIGDYLGESALITLGEAYQKATDHEDKHPKMFMP